MRWRVKALLNEYLAIKPGLGHIEPKADGSLEEMLELYAREVADQRRVDGDDGRRGDVGEPARAPSPADAVVLPPPPPIPTFESRISAPRAASAATAIPFPPPLAPSPIPPPLLPPGVLPVPSPIPPRGAPAARRPRSPSPPVDHPPPKRARAASPSDTRDELVLIRELLGVIRATIERDQRRYDSDRTLAAQHHNQMMAEAQAVRDHERRMAELLNERVRMELEMARFKPGVAAPRSDPQQQQQLEQ
ncbi:hypothetical protein GGF32_001716 [Allomyces javanicus]|nr:hypothetical protein GGF32_001716 [Allomyces javanicus]